MDLDQHAGDKPTLVSVIIPFYNPPQPFFRQAIESVLHQSYKDFEILLIDDGSGSESVIVAEEYAESHPKQVLVYHHPNRQNRGISTSRQLGIQKARGKFIAFLDADDIWLANKLEEQVALLEALPEVAMLYGNTLYWYSWSGKESDLQRDFLPKMGLQTERAYQPPRLLPLYIAGKTAVPCIGSLLIRSQVFEAVGGFEAEFTGMYEDQVFYAKISLEAPIYISNQCWDQYRQHSASMTAMAINNGREQLSRKVFLEWLEKYLLMKEVRDPEIWLALRRDKWFNHDPDILLFSETGKKLLRRLKKWLLKFEIWFLPIPISHWIWSRGIRPE